MTALLLTASLATACGGSTPPPTCQQVCEAAAAADSTTSVESCLPRCVARVVRMRADAASVLLTCLRTRYGSGDPVGPIPAECRQAAIDAVAPGQTAAATAFAPACQMRQLACGTGGFDLGYCGLAPALLDDTLGRTTTCLGLDCAQISDCLLESTGGLGD